MVLAVRIVAALGWGAASGRGPGGLWGLLMNCFSSSYIGVLTFRALTELYT